MVLAQGLPAADAVGPGFVEGNLVAHYLAGAGLALLVVGVLREVRADGTAGRDTTGPRPAPPRPAGGATVTPLVSVVVPTRNAGRTIETCLRSVRAQTWPALELIVVDNGSTDATWAVAERLADLALRGGPERSAQRNLGIDHAAGEWVCYVDADMELGPEVVERAVRAGTAVGAVGVAIPEESVGPGFWTRCRTLERRCLRDEPELLWPRLVRTGYLRDTGGFAPWLTGTEDAELHRRMVAHGVRIARAEGLILHHEGRLTLGGLARKRFYYGRGLLAYRRAHPGRWPPRPGRPPARCGGTAAGCWPSPGWRPGSR